MHNIIDINCTQKIMTNNSIYSNCVEPRKIVCLY